MAEEFKSRYDYFDSSDVLDTDGENFPDPLNLNYNLGSLTKIPAAYNMTIPDLTKFWYFMYTKYGISYLDDILLNENNIPYITAIKPNETIYLPKIEDLTGYIDKALANVLEEE